MSRTTVLLFVSLAVILAGCNPGEPGGSGSAGLSAAPVAPGSGSPAPDPPPPPGDPAPRNSSPARVDDSMFLARATYIAESEGQLTLNNQWTRQDAENMNLAYVDWQRTRAESFRWQGASYTTLVPQYRERRRQCEIDSQVTYRQRYPDGPFGTDPSDNPDFPICNPTLTGTLLPGSWSSLDCGRVLTETPGPRYGYWCGRGHPPFGKGSALAPQPLDAVDFCCMMHDAQVWDDGGSRPNERGMAMCLAQASQYPAGIVTFEPVIGDIYVPGGKLPDVEFARQFWFHCSVVGTLDLRPNPLQEVEPAPSPAVRR